MISSNFYSEYVPVRLSRVLIENLFSILFNFNIKYDKKDFTKI